MSDELIVENPEVEPIVEEEAPIQEEPTQEAPPADDPKAKARAFYLKRQEEKIERENQARMEQEKAALQERIETGDIPSDEMLSDVLQEKDQIIRQYELKEFLANNPIYESHKEGIEQAIADPKFNGFTHEEVANMVAAKTLVELQLQDKKVNASSTVIGSSARSANAPLDYKNMSRDELEKRASRAKFN
jgi:hypothetical protein